MNVSPPDVLAVPVPLVIGVTGHRDLRPQDQAELEEVLRVVFRDLRERFSSTPIVLLSPLAEGADRLAANIALEFGARLVVPLPVAQQLYEEDFNSPESLATFRSLVKQAQHCFVVPIPAHEKRQPQPNLARDQQYEVLGRYIAHESQILLALWDGKPSDKTGGTANVVKFQLQGPQDDHDCDLRPPELFPVYQIVSPRESNPCPNGRAFDLVKRYPAGFENEEQAKNYYDKIFHNLDNFNHKISNADRSLIAKATQSKRDLLDDLEESTLSRQDILDLDRYAMTDALAQRFQQTMVWMNFALHWMVFAASLCFVLFAHLPGNRRLLLLSSLLMLTIAFLVFGYSRLIGVDTKSHDYRAIAEGARVRLFWRMAGIDESVADNYLGNLRTELDWIRNGLRGWELEAHIAPRPSTLVSEECLAIVRRLWINGQIEYFADAKQSNEKKLRKMEMLVHFCFWLLILAALGMLGSSVLIPAKPGSEAEPTGKIALIIAVDVFIAAGALLHHATHQRAYAQHVKQFLRMETVFHTAREHVDRQSLGNNLAGVQSCLRKLGQEALSENGDWVLLHRERPMELPPP